MHSFSLHWPDQRCLMICCAFGRAGAGDRSELPLGLERRDGCVVDGDAGGGVSRLGLCICFCADPQMEQQVNELVRQHRVKQRRAAEKATKKWSEETAVCLRPRPRSGCHTDLPLASASSDMIRRNRVLLSSGAAGGGYY